MKKKKLLLFSVCLMFFIDAIGVGLIFPILPTLFMDNKFGLILEDTYFRRETLYSICLAIYPLASMLGMPILGGMSDKRGRGNVILLGLGMLSINYLFGGLSIVIKNVELLICSRLLSGFFSGTYSVGNALISDVSEGENERISNFKLPVISTMLGFILGPSLSILIGNLGGTNALPLPFYVAFVISGINFLLFAYIFKLSGEKGHSQQGLQVDEHRSKSFTDKLLKMYSLVIISIFRSQKYIFTDKNTKLLACSHLLYQFGFGLFIQSLPLYLTSKYNYTASYIGGFYVCMAIILLLSTYFFQAKISRYINYVAQIELALISMSLLLISDFFVGKIFSSLLEGYFIYIFYFVTILFYFSIPYVTLGFTNLFSSSVSKSDQGKALGGYGQITAIGLFISGLLIGQVFLIDYNLILLVSGIFWLLSYILLKKRLRNFASTELETKNVSLG